jgi:hypothetical protein
MNIFTSFRIAVQHTVMAIWMDALLCGHISSARSNIVGNSARHFEINKYLVCDIDANI